MSDKFEREVINMIADSRRYFRISPLVLGGGSGESGGGGGPPGGFVGHLPQRRVAFDTTESESNVIPESGASLVTNLNRIRYRISQLEAGSGVGVSDFISLTDTPTSYEGQSGKAVVVNVAEDGLEFGVVGSGGVEEAPIDGKQYARKDADWVEVTASGGGGTIGVWMPDAPPETPGSLDDEFTSALTGWTTFDPNSRLTTTRLSSQNMLKLSTPNGHWELSGLYKELSGDFTVYTKVSLSSQADTYTSNNYISAGLAFWTDPTDTSEYILAWGVGLKGDVQLFGGAFDELYESASIASVKGTTLYLRVRRTGDEAYFGVSTDGISWLELTYYELIGTVYFGPFVCSQDEFVGLEGNTTGLFSYIRYVNSDVGRDGIMNGRLV